jgi:hypothetical protein
MSGIWHLLLSSIRIARAICAITKSESSLQHGGGSRFCLVDLIASLVTEWASSFDGYLPQ